MPMTTPPRKTASDFDPDVLRLFGRTSLGSHRLTRIDPLTGALLWEIDVFDKRSVSSPVAV